MLRYYEKSVSKLQDFYEEKTRKELPMSLLQIGGELF